MADYEWRFVRVGQGLINHRRHREEQIEKEKSVWQLQAYGPTNPVPSVSFAGN